MVPSGPTFTEDHKAKISASWTPERKAQHSATMKRLWAIPKFRVNNKTSSGYIHTADAKARMSTAKIGKIRPEKIKAKISKTLSGSKQTPTHIQRRAEKLKGFKHSDKSRKNMSQSKMGTKNPKGFAGKTHTEEYRRNMSARLQGISLDEWTGFVAHLPYCPKFNEPRKEYIRNLYNRTCTICGKSTFQNISKNGTWLGRLAVDHIDENKLQGCDDWEWRLAPLCPFCHGKMKDQRIPQHLLLQLLLLNNKKQQTNFLFFGTQ